MEDNIELLRNAAIVDYKKSIEKLTIAKLEEYGAKVKNAEINFDDLSLKGDSYFIYYKDLNWMVYFRTDITNAILDEGDNFKISTSLTSRFDGPYGLFGLIDKLIEAHSNDLKSYIRRNQLKKSNPNLDAMNLFEVKRFRDL